MAKQRREYEDGLIQEMLQSPRVKETLAELGFVESTDGEPHAIKCMRQGAANIAAWFENDSHEKRLTLNLPATASMPDAFYSPDEIYKAK